MLFAGLLLITINAAPLLDSRCSVLNVETGEHIIRPTKTAGQLVDGADVIVRAVALRQFSRPDVQQSLMAFRVVEVLSGSDVPDSLAFMGWADERDEYNRGAVPYHEGRPGLLGGSCYAFNYKPEAEYLFILRRGGYGLTPYHSLFSPTNEQVRGPEDPWLLWVRQRIRSPERLLPAPERSAERDVRPGT